MSGPFSLTETQNCHGLGNFIYKLQNYKPQIHHLKTIHKSYFEERNKMKTNRKLKIKWNKRKIKVFYKFDLGHHFQMFFFQTRSACKQQCRYEDKILFYFVV